MLLLTKVFKGFLTHGFGKRNDSNTTDESEDLVESLCTAAYEFRKSRAKIS